jgi:tetratricopeptide (TPR) repeat protein
VTPRPWLQFLIARKCGAYSLQLFLVLAAVPVCPFASTQGPASWAPQGKAQPRTARSTSAPLSNSEFENLKKQAEAAKDSNKIPEALRLYQRILGQKPEWAEGWWYLGTLRYEADEYAPAAKAFGRFTTLEPENGHGWAMLGLCEFRLKQYLGALDHIVKGRSLGLGDNEDLARVVRYHQAVLLTLGKQFDAAQELLNGFAVEQRESPQVLDALGMAVLRIPGPIDTLSEQQKEMIREFGMAAFLAGARRVEESRKLYTNLEAKYRGAPNVAFACGMRYLVAGEAEMATEFFKKELARDPNHVESLLKLALQSLNSGKFEEGLPFATKALKLDPESFAAHYTVGRIYMELNEVSKAVAVLEEAAKIAPNVASVYFVLSRAYARANRPTDAARARAEFARLEKLDKQKQGGSRSSASQ